MKPCFRRTKFGGNLLQNFDFEQKNTILGVMGVVKKQGTDYQNATVALYSKNNLRLITVRKPNSNGSYIINGLSDRLPCFVIAFDNQSKFNAVIQDMVIPK